MKRIAHGMEEKPLMGVTICPWCQNEIPQEEGEEQERWCPVCENELGGYRTLTIDIDKEDDLAEADGEAADIHHESDGKGDLDWEDHPLLAGSRETLLQWEETVEKMLDDQDEVPECPNCREYMFEAGHLQVTADQFRPRIPASVGKVVLEAPFELTLHVCPSCFAVRHSLGEQSRNEMQRRLMEDC
jgi:hypothetical protein